MSLEYDARKARVVRGPPVYDEMGSPVHMGYEMLVGYYRWVPKTFDPGANAKLAKKIYDEQTPRNLWHSVTS